MKILALDIGTVRVGVAIADTTLGVAHARPFLPRDENSACALEKLCRDERITQIVIGHPRSMSGQDSSQTQHTAAFAAELHAALAIPITLVDERLSSREAHANLSAGGIAHKKHRPLVDSESARILLQSWLDQQA